MERYQTSGLLFASKRYNIVLFVSFQTLLSIIPLAFKAKIEEGSTKKQVNNYPTRKSHSHVTFYRQTRCLLVDSSRTANVIFIYLFFSREGIYQIQCGGKMWRRAHNDRTKVLICSHLLSLAKKDYSIITKITSIISIFFGGAEGFADAHPVIVHLFHLAREWER